MKEDTKGFTVSSVSGAGGSLGDSSACGRQTAKGVLSDMIARKTRELDSLRVLHGSLPDAMLPAADEALWSILTSHR